MKAIVYHNYGSPDVLKLAEVEKPTVGDDEVLIKTHATGLNAADWRLMRADPFLIRFMFGGIFKPKRTILGADIAGEVEAIGSRVKQFQVGDKVYGESSGGLAEYTAAPESALALKPTNLTFAEAAAVPMAAITALQGLRDQGQIQPGQKVLVNGASGGVGTFAVQLAKAFGTEVTAVCSTSKMETARTLGADHVIDYTQEDFTQSGKLYDLIYVANGNQPISAYKRALTPSGVCIIAGGGGAQLFQALILGPWMSRSGQKLGVVSATTTHKDLLVLKEMIEAGKIKPVIDRSYPLPETPDAMRYLEKGHAHGKIVITQDGHDLS